MSSRLKKSDASEVLILRTRRFRKSDAVIRFLENENIPHRVLPLEEDSRAQELSRQWNLKSSAGIIIADQPVLSTDLLENGQIKNRKQTIKNVFEYAE
ncbi:MAG: hypothetical protein JW976_01455 [Syntrophaceae bacterium]|nr:hypothetical protein [Syntrophaceae bacterium]